MSELTGDRFGIATIEEGDALIPAVVTERGVRTLSGLLGADAPGSVREMVLQDWDRWCDSIAAALPAADAGGWTDEATVSFAPPLPDPSNLYLAGANYWDHIKEMNVAVPDKAVDDVFHFMLPSSSLLGHGHEIHRPADVDQLDWEVELAVVIGRRAESVSTADALDYVAGYSVANDVSARGPAMFHPIFGLRFGWAKGQATLNPMGPTIVPARFVPDPGALALSTHVNGEVRQESGTDQMIWSVQEQIAYLSGRAPLLPGDVILTGTPAGTAAAYNGAYLKDGDVLTSRVESLGVLVNRVVVSS
jgi:2-keto-4-pentenoate hydratase/2-oxohepta-3-ene-1,7-dioic acid hydratase in catechol pathway